MEASCFRKNRTVASQALDQQIAAVVDCIWKRGFQLVEIFLGLLFLTVFLQEFAKHETGIGSDLNTIAIAAVAEFVDCPLQVLDLRFAGFFPTGGVQLRATGPVRLRIFGGQCFQ